VIHRLVVRNFRSLEELELDLAPLTALVGANGSGKSAILRTINLLLGHRYPTLNSLRLPYDFTAGDDSRDMIIRVRLEEPLTHVDKLSKDHEILGFELSCKPYKRPTGTSQPGDPNFDFTPLDKDGKAPMVALAMGKGGPSFGPLTHVPNVLRDQARVLFVDHRRSVTQHQPWARGSIIARLLRSGSS
jgi:energy-coupling factor transporter ATP-binding protein EcfA2